MVVTILIYFNCTKNTRNILYITHTVLRGKNDVCDYCFRSMYSAFFLWFESIVYED